MRRKTSRLSAKIALAAAGTAAALDQFRKRTTIGFWTEEPGSGYDIEKNVPPMTAWTWGVWLPYTLYSNELGCFDRPFAGGEHALLVGDSFAEGMLPLESTWGALAEERSGLRILKCGVMGYGTHDELLKARRVLAQTGKRPRLLILSYYMNDLQDDWLAPQRAVVDGAILIRNTCDFDTGEKTEYSLPEIRERMRLSRIGLDPAPCPPGGAFQRLRCFFYDRSVLYRRVREPLRRALAPRLAGLIPEREGISFFTYEPNSWLDRAWRSHLANVADLNRLAKKSGARLLVVIIPTKQQVYPFLRKAPLPGGPALDYELPNKKLAALAAKEGFSLLDLTGTFRRLADQTPRKAFDGESGLYSSEDIHWTYRGHRLASLLLAERLLVDGISPAADRRARLAAVRAELAAFGRTP